MPGKSRHKTSKDRPKVARRGEIQWPQGPASTLGAMFETPLLDTLDVYCRQTSRIRLIPAYDFARCDFILAYLFPRSSPDPYPEVPLSDFARTAWAWRHRDDTSISGLLCEIKNGHPSLSWLESPAQVFFVRIHGCDDTIYAIPRDRVKMLANARWARRKMYLQKDALLHHPLLVPYASLEDELPRLFEQLFSSPTRYVRPDPTLNSPLLGSPGVWARCTKVLLRTLFEFTHPKHAWSFKCFEKLYHTLVPPGTRADQRELQIHRSPSQPLGGDFVVKMDELEFVVQHKAHAHLSISDWFRPPSYFDFLFWHRSLQESDQVAFEEEQHTPADSPRRSSNQLQDIPKRKARSIPSSRVGSLKTGDSPSAFTVGDEEATGFEDDASFNAWSGTDVDDSDGESPREGNQQSEDNNRGLEGELVVFALSMESNKVFQYGPDLASKLREYLSNASMLAHGRLSVNLGNLLNEEAPEVEPGANDPDELARLQQDRLALEEYGTFWKVANCLAMHWYEFGNTANADVAFIYLNWDHNHPLGDMFVVRHQWTLEERRAFKETRRLPLSLDLVCLARERRRGTILRFGCRNYRNYPSRSQHIPLQQLSAELPLTSQKFFLLGASNKHVQSHLPGNLLLLPSDFIKFPKMAHDVWVESAATVEAARNPPYTMCLLVGHTQPTDKFQKDQMLKDVKISNFWSSPDGVVANLQRVLEQETGETFLTHPEVRDHSSLDSFEIDEYLVDAHTVVRAALNYGIQRDGDHIHHRTTGWYGLLGEEKDQGMFPI